MTFSNLMRTSALATVVVLGAHGANAETFRWASTTDPQTMDPHAVNAAPVLSFLNNIYEGLVRRDQSMSIEPSLATSWEPLDGENGWRFNLRQGVTFQNGAAFNAEDVMFSYQRASNEAADVRSWFAPVSDVRVVDDYTVDFVTTAPNPLFPDSIANFMILDKDWAESNDAALPARDAENFATMNVNGTGPFTLASRDPGVETRLVPNPTWWDDGRAQRDRSDLHPDRQLGHRSGGAVVGRDRLHPADSAAGCGASRRPRRFQGAGGRRNPRDHVRLRP